MVVAEAIIKEEVSALAPPAAVWKVLTTPATWEKWWGGAVQKVEPGWQDGASIQWALGAPSRIEKCVPPTELVVVGSSGTRTVFHLEKGKTGPYEVTIISYAEDFSSSRVSVSDPGAVRAQIRTSLLKLQSLAEIEAVHLVPEPPANAKAGNAARKPWWHFWD